MANIEAFDNQLGKTLSLIAVLGGGDPMGVGASATILMSLLATERPDIIEAYTEFSRKQAATMPNNEGVEGMMGVKLAIDTLIKAYDEGVTSIPGLDVGNG